MRILVLSNLFPPEFVGGAELLCAQVCTHLRDRGHDVTVLSSGEAAPSDRTPGLRVERRLRLTRRFGTPASAITPFDRWQTYRHNYRETRALLALESFDVVFAWSQRRLSLGAARAASDAGARLAFSYNDDAIAAYAPRPLQLRPRQVARRLLEQVLTPGDVLGAYPASPSTAISLHLKRGLASSGIDTRLTQVIYQAIELDRFPCKANPGTVGSPVRLLYVGSLLPEKGVHTVIEAAHALQVQARMPVQLAVVGDGIAAYEQRLRALGATGTADVTFSGRVAHGEGPAIYRSHDVLLFASNDREAFGLTQLEAMASGMVVVSTAEGGHGEMMRDGRNCLTFPYADAAALTCALARLVAEPQLGPGLARRARAQVARHFSFDRYISELEQFLQSAAKESDELRHSA